MSDEQAAAPTPDITAHEAAELATEETVEVDGESPAPGGPTATPATPATSDTDDIVDAGIVPTPPALGTAGAPAPAFDYTDSGVPTLDYVRDRIEKRWGTAQGSAEIAGATEAAEQQKKRDEDREKLAAEKLAEIRRGLTT